MIDVIRATAARPRVRQALRLLMAALVVAALYLAVRDVGRHWREVVDTIGALRPRWSLVGLACAILIAAYALLVESWRRLLAAWNVRVAYGDAARIWSISNLARYIPGAGWQMGAMAALGKRVDVPASASSGAAMISTLITMGAGCAVTAVCGATVLHLPVATRVLIYVGAAGLVFAAPVITWIGRIAARLLPRVEVPTLTHGTVALATLFSAIAWVAYGLGFMMLTRAFFPAATAGLTFYIGAYTGAYIVGFLAFMTSAGLGPREATLLAALRQAGFTPAASAIMPVVARLWMTGMEVGLAAAFLAVDAVARATLRRR